MSIQDLHIIFTGGTIEKLYDPSLEGNVMRDQSCIPAFLDKVVKPHFSYTHETLCMLDSNEITPNLRAELLVRIQSAESQNILIVHGTSKMVETQDDLQEKLKGNKTVILTGAMIPLDGFYPTDSGFNLGFALAGFGLLDPGIYIAMNGCFFTAGCVQKNVEAARFENL